MHVSSAKLGTEYPFSLIILQACRAITPNLQRWGGRSQKSSTMLKVSELASSRAGGRPHLSGCLAGALCSASAVFHPASSPRGPCGCGNQLLTSRPKNSEPGFRVNKPTFTSARTIALSKFSTGLISRANLENRTQCILRKRNKSPFIQQEQHVLKIQNQLQEQIGQITGILMPCPTLRTS